MHVSPPPPVSAEYRSTARCWQVRPPCFSGTYVSLRPSVSPLCHWLSSFLFFFFFSSSAMSQHMGLWTWFAQYQPQSQTICCGTHSETMKRTNMHQTFQTSVWWKLSCLQERGVRVTSTKPWTSLWFNAFLHSGGFAFIDGETGLF